MNYLSEVLNECFNHMRDYARTLHMVIDKSCLRIWFYNSLQANPWTKLDKVHTSNNDVVSSTPGCTGACVRVPLVIQASKFFNMASLNINSKHIIGWFSFEQTTNHHNLAFMAENEKVLNKCIYQNKGRPAIINDHHWIKDDIALLVHHMTSWIRLRKLYLTALWKTSPCNPSCLGPSHHLPSR